MTIKEGKYKGMDINQVPDNYLLWLSNQPSYGKKYKKAEREEIAKRLAVMPKPKPPKFW